MTRTSSPRPRARPPPAAETEEAEEAENPKATTTSVEPQLLSTTSAQPTNASTRAGESYTIKIDESMTLRGRSALINNWTVDNESVVKVTGDGSSATVKGLAEGSATVTHKWGLFGGNFEKFFVTVKGVNVYFYTLIPNIKYDPNADADTQWNGMGVGTITGIDSPANHKVETTLYEGDELNNLKITYPADLAQTTITVDGKKYAYAEPGSEEAMQPDHYTIEWTELKVANGANAGANNKNPVVETGTNTYHLDGTVTLIDEAKIQVGFRVKQPGAEDFGQPIPEYYTLYTKGVALSSIAYPHYEGDKMDGPDGYTYVFDGWYADKDCTDEVDFKSSKTLSTNTTFYGRYVLDKDVLEYDANGGTGKMDPTEGKLNGQVTVAQNGFTAPEGKVFDSWNTDPNGSCTKYYPDETYTLNPDANDVLYAQWRDDLSNFTVTGGTWYYDGDTHGVTVSGVKKGDTLTFELINDEGKVVDKSEEAVDSDTGTYTSECGAKDVADSGTMNVTLTRGLTTSETKTAELTINKRQITFTSATLSKPYDGTGKFDKNGVTVSSNLDPDNGGGWADDEGATYDLNATSPKNVGPAVTNTFNVNAIYGTDLNNYDITKVEGTLTVTPVTITVTADNPTKVEGEADPSLTTRYDSSVLVGSEKPGWGGEVEREAGEEPGSYAINRGTLKLVDGENGFLATNYKLVFVPGTLTITAADDGDDDDTPVTPVDPVDPGDDGDNPGGGGDDTNPGGGGTTTGGGTNPAPVAVTAGDDADDTDDTDDAEDEETVEEDETPLTDGTESDSEQIGDDTTPLASGETNEQTCWTHWAMLAGLVVTVVYFALSAARTRRATSKLASFEDDVLGRR